MLQAGVALAGHLHGGTFGTQPRSSCLPSKSQQRAILITIEPVLPTGCMPYDVEDLKIWLGLALLFLTLLQHAILSLVGVLQPIHRDLPFSTLTLLCITSSMCITTIVAPKCCSNIFKLLLQSLASL
jgi:hypothetical protein